MRLKRVVLVLLAVAGLGSPSYAQDPQFSQFYAAPLYLNPAFAGSTQLTRAGMNYRNQWPSIEANFVTFSGYADHFFEDYNSGVGVIFMHDREGRAALKSTFIGLQYAYQLRVANQVYFRPGIQFAWYNRSVSFADLTFGDQFDEFGEVIQPTGEVFANTNKNFFDISAGGILYTANAWIGFTASHLNTPSQSFDEDVAIEELPIKYSFHGGYKFYLKPGVVGSGLFAKRSERSITPTFQYKAQGDFDQLDIGLYVTLEPVIIGTWYRGLPMKSLEGFSNNESMVFLIGFTKKGPEDTFNIGYSYDYTISRLQNTSGGAHEISISYIWSNRDPRKPPRDVMRIPCPDF